jgi:hypothetical protein
MKKNLFLLILLFLCLSVTGCCAQEKGDVSVFSQGENQEKTETSPFSAFSWDFGQVKEPDVVKHTFIFKNETDKPLTITGVNTSCGCTGSKTDKNQLATGESANIDVQFNSKGYNGPVQQFVYVNTDNVDNSVTRYIIKAEVIK